MQAHYRLRTLVVPAVVAVIAVAAEVSFAQIGYTLMSLEWLVADADVVVRGSIVDVSREPSDGQWVWLTVTLKVDETLKGKHAPRVKFAVHTLAGDKRYQQWKDSRQQQMWFLVGTKRDEDEILARHALKPNGGGWSMIRLGPVVPDETSFSRFPPPIMTMDLNMLKEPDAPSWPRFHGPKGDNCSTETGLLKKWPPEGPKLLWTADGLGFGYSSVSIAHGTIYTAGNIDERTVITALDLDGKVRWRFNEYKAYTGHMAGTRATPTIDGDRLYHKTPLGDLFCLNAKTGKKLWGLNILEKFGSENIRWALAESLLVDGNHVICCPGGPKTAVAALDKMTGKTVWQSASADGDLAGYSSPIVVEYGDLRIILAITAKALIGVDADTGKLLFRYPHETTFDANVAMPIFHDGQVFISSGYGAGSELVQLTVKGDEVTADRVWRSEQLDNHHGGVILVDGYLYGASHNFNKGKWICLDWKTGRMKYAEEGVGKGSATYADGMLYTLSSRHIMGLVRATPDRLELSGKFEIPKLGKTTSRSHPVVCGGRLYIRHNVYLYAYDVKAAR